MPDKTLKIESSIISIDSNITDNIVRKVIMYSRKSVWPRMEPWGTPALTRYSCEDFPFRTTQSRILPRKEEIRANIWPEIPYDLRLWRSACQSLSKALDISSATARVAPDLLKALAILSDKNCKKICSWSRKPKTTLEMRKKVTFL